MAFEVGNRHFTLALDGPRLLVPDDPAMKVLLTRRRPVRTDQSLQRLHSRAQGVHRRGARRDRQHPRRHGGRARARTPRGIRRVLPVAPHRRRVRRGVQGHLRVLDPDPHPHLPAQGPARRSRTGARVIKQPVVAIPVASPCSSCRARLWRRFPAPSSRSSSSRPSILLSTWRRCRPGSAACCSAWRCS